MANYGMDPLMGKYHQSYCPQCDLIMQEEPPVVVCPVCGSFDKLVIGVYDRIVQIQDHPDPVRPEGRPPYHYRGTFNQPAGGWSRSSYQKLDPFSGQ